MGIRKFVMQAMQSEDGNQKMLELIEPILHTCMHNDKSKHTYIDSKMKRATKIR